MFVVRDCRSRFRRLYEGGILELVLILAAVFFFSVYAELFLETNEIYRGVFETGLLNGTIVPSVLLRCASFFLIALIGVLLFLKIPHTVLKVLFKWRYCLSIGLIVLLTILDINNSSLGAWSGQLAGVPQDGLLFGIPRSIRSDEFNVSTLMTLSQDHNAYLPLSDIVRGDVTDTRLVYNLPSWSLVTLFRPQLWGYLLFGSSRGLAFFWAFKWVALFMASFECFRIISHDNKIYSLVFACMLTFSPIVQWWGCCEILIFGQLLVVALNVFLRKRENWKKAIAAITLAWLAGCYIMLLYPAWMVPFFYIFALMGIWVTFDYRKDVKRGSCSKSFTAKCLLWLIIPIALLVCAIAGIFYQSSDVLMLTSQTVYPGQRFETGGNGFWQLFNYGYTLFFPIASPPASNAPELSAVFCLFPLGSVLAVYVAIKKRSRLFLLLVPLQILFVLYMVVGFPPILAKITLFSNIPTFRMILPVGYVELVLLLGSLVFCDDGVKVKHRSVAKSGRLFILFASVALSIIMVVLCSYAIQNYSGRIFSVLLFFAFLSLFCMIFSQLIFGSNFRGQRVLFSIIFLLVVVPGICVNPIQKGIATVRENGFSDEVQAIIGDDNESRWLVEDSWQISNLCVSLGAPTVGSTNAYPDLDLWHSIDREGSQEDVYNRYAHYLISLSDGDTAFDLIQADLIHLQLNYNDLKTMDIKYLISPKSYSNDEMRKIGLNPIGSESGFYFYEVK